MKRILVYGTSNYYGGIELFFLTLINNIDSKKIIFDFVVSADSTCPYENEIVKNNGKVYPIASWGGNSFKHKKAFQQILTENQYDFVWANATSASNISIFPIVKKINHTKLIIHSHGAAFETRNSGVKYEVLKFMHHLNLRKLNDYADIKFASSKKAGAWLFGEEEVSRGNVTIVNNGIQVSDYLFDNEKRSEIRASLGIQDEFVLIAAGRLEEVKNYPYLIRVYQKLAQKIPESLLLILGEGSLQESLVTLTDELGITEKVKFLGYSENLPSLFTAADAFLLTSFSEGLSIVTIEAQASGLNCYVSNEIPAEVGVTDLVHFLSIELPEEEWAQQIIEDRKMKQNREEYNNEIVVSDFNIKSTVRKIEELVQ